MNTKNNYLSIGGISKLTGSSIKALRYYERIGILKPAFINPDSGYRYYSSEQIAHIEIIQLCVEFDITLKDLTKFIDADENVDFSSLLAYGKKIAQKKLKAIQRGLKFIDYAEKEIQLSEGPNSYSCELPETLLYVFPYEPPFNLVTFYESFSQLEAKLILDELDSFTTLNYGLLHEYLPSQVNRYFFTELPKHIQTSMDRKILPAGLYQCQQVEGSQIEQSPEIFADLFHKSSHLFVMETELFSSKSHINRQKIELKAISIK